MSDSKQPQPKAVPSASSSSSVAATPAVTPLKVFCAIRGGGTEGFQISKPFDACLDAIAVVEGLKSYDLKVYSYVGKEELAKYVIHKCENGCISEFLGEWTAGAVQIEISEADLKKWKIGVVGYEDAMFRYDNSMFSTSVVAGIVQAFEKLHAELKLNLGHSYGLANARKRRF